MVENNQWIIKFIFIFYLQILCSLNSHLEVLHLVKFTSALWTSSKMVPYCNYMIFAYDYPLFVVLKSPGWYIYHVNGWKTVINAIYFLSYCYATGRVGPCKAVVQCSLDSLERHGVEYVKKAIMTTIRSSQKYFSR